MRRGGGEYYVGDKEASNIYIIHLVCVRLWLQIESAGGLYALFQYSRRQQHLFRTGERVRAPREVHVMVG